LGGHCELRHSVRQSPFVSFVDQETGGAVLDQFANPATPSGHAGQRQGTRFVQADRQPLAAASIVALRCKDDDIDLFSQSPLEKIVWYGTVKENVVLKTQVSREPFQPIPERPVAEQVQFSVWHTTASFGESMQQCLVPLAGQQ